MSTAATTSATPATAVVRPGRRPRWVGTSWKMNKTLAEAAAYADVLTTASLPSTDPVVFVLPPLTSLHLVARRLRDTPVLVGAQNAHHEPDGPVTGEVSMTMVADAGAQLVEIGHAERRTRFAETDEVVAEKVGAAQRAGLIALLCVGESAAARADGATIDVVTDQVRRGLVRCDDPAGVVVAYEPQWAIGERGHAATPEQIAPVVMAIADTVGGLSGASPRAVLYGGSVNVAHAADVLAVDELDGVFVGRAGLDPHRLLALIATVASTTRPPDHA